MVGLYAAVGGGAKLPTASALLATLLASSRAAVRRCFTLAGRHATLLRKAEPAGEDAGWAGRQATQVRTRSPCGGVRESR